jgi:tetratricopeptide (TPR) repeat protein
MNVLSAPCCVLGAACRVQRAGYHVLRAARILQAALCTEHRAQSTQHQHGAPSTQHLARSPLCISLCAILLGCAGCGPSRAPLQPVSLPDLSRSDVNVQAQGRDLYSSLTRLIDDRRTSDADLGAAYGKLGMLLQAAEYYDAAEPCYRNAQTLVPGEVRWPYFLGHLHMSKGETEKAEVAFKRALELLPDQVAAMIWLGRLYLDEGRTDEADQMFTKALALAPQAVAALAGLGRAALAKRDYARAVQNLERALAIDPQSDSLHSPLAIAYRGLGQLDKAEPHLRQWRNRDILVPDPLKQELDLLLESSLSYELRGVRALEARDWPTAVATFRKGLELSQENTMLRRSLQHKLGTALFMTGDVRGARAQFEEVVRLSPAEGVDESAAKANFSLAVLMMEAGERKAAIEHLSAAVKYQPNYVEAHIALADALSRTGKVQESLVHYKAALEINPRAAQASMGAALALARARRYQEARDRLQEAMQLQPDHPEFAHALARLLAAAPDDRVRDGQRSMQLIQQLFKENKSTDLGETMAMAFAELGDFREAAAIQRGVMAAAQKAGLQDAVRRMAGNLELYERRQPCRTPFPDNDPFKPPTRASGPP